MAWRFLIRFLFSILFLGLIISASVDAGKKKPPGKPVNINTATSQELQQVPGIGPKRLEKMRKYLTVGKAVAPKSPQGIAKPVAAKPATPRANPLLPQNSRQINHKRDFSLRSK